MTVCSYGLYNVWECVCVGFVKYWMSVGVYFVVCEFVYEWFF